MVDYLYLEADEDHVSLQFKEKKGDEFVGGLPFYGRKLLGNKVWIGSNATILSAPFLQRCRHDKRC